MGNSQNGRRRFAFSTPWGQVAANFEKGELCGLRFESGFSPPETLAAPLGAGEVKLVEAVKGYLSGDLRALERLSLPLAPRGTDFQRRLWQFVRRIRPGETLTYSQLGREVGGAGYARAVGRACAANPIWLLIPCHRVLPKRGGLGGYAGGVVLKRKLLELERMAGFPGTPNAHGLESSAIGLLSARRGGARQVAGSSA